MTSNQRRFVAPAILLGLVLLLALGFWWGWKQLSKPPAEVKPNPCVTQQASTLKVEQVTVQVLNGGSTAGRAGHVTDQFRNAGFQVKAAGNSDRTDAVTTVIGANETDAAVALVAGFLPNAVKQGDGRTDGTITVLVGDKFDGFKADAPKQIDVPGGSVCLPSKPKNRS